MHASQIASQRISTTNSDRHLNPLTNSQAIASRSNIPTVKQQSSQQNRVADQMVGGDDRGSPSSQTASSPPNASRNSQKVYSDFDAAISEIKVDFEKHRESIRNTSRSMNFNAFNSEAADQRQDREELPEIALGISVSAGLTSLREAIMASSPPKTPSTSQSSNRSTVASARTTPPQPVQHYNGATTGFNGHATSPSQPNLAAAGARPSTHVPAGHIAQAAASSSNHIEPPVRRLEDQSMQSSSGDVDASQVASHAFPTRFLELTSGRLGAQSGHGVGAGSTAALCAVVT